MENTLYSGVQNYSFYFTDKITKKTDQFGVTLEEPALHPLVPLFK